MNRHHAVVWLDHREARIFFFDRESVEKDTLSTELAHHQLHNKSGSRSGKRGGVEPEYYHDIVKALSPAKEWLVVGPGSAKLELVKHIHAHDSQLAARVIGVETVDHPSDGQLVAHARAYFRAADRMLP